MDWHSSPSSVGSFVQAHRWPTDFHPGVDFFSKLKNDTGIELISGRFMSSWRGWPGRFWDIFGRQLCGWICDIHPYPDGIIALEISPGEPKKMESGKVWKMGALEMTGF